MYFVRPLSQHYYHTQSCALANQLFGIHVSNSLYIGTDYNIWYCCFLTSLIVYDTKNYHNLLVAYLTRVQKRSEKSECL